MRQSMQSDTGRKAETEVGPFLTINETGGLPYDQMLKTFEAKGKKNKPPCFVGTSKADNALQQRPSSICIHWCSHFDGSAYRLCKPAKKGSCRGWSSGSDEKLKKILGLS